MRISILCPTRGRIKRARLMRDSALLTAERPRDLEFVFYIDHDDEETIQKLYLLTRTVVETPALITQIIISNEKIIAGLRWNVCWKYATGDIFMLAADDIVFRTMNWDRYVKEAFQKFPDRIAYVYTHDGFRGPESYRNFGTHGFVHRNWTDTLGYFSTPYFERRCNDSWLDAVSRGIYPQRARHLGLQKVLIEHMYFRWGKAEVDQTYKDQYALGHAYKEVWYSKKEEILEEAAKLRKFIEEFDENSSNKST